MYCVTLKGDLLFWMTSPLLKAVVVDTIPAWIRAHLDGESGTGSRKVKKEPQKEKRNKLMFLELDVLSVKLEVTS